MHFTRNATRFLHCHSALYVALSVAGPASSLEVGKELRVSGRSPELTATGAKRPSGRKSGCRERSDIHPASCPLSLGGWCGRFAVDVRWILGEFALGLR